MLDEVDKIGMDFRGDPASALLDSPHPLRTTASGTYMDVDVDLTRMFVTANVLDTIPGAPGSDGGHPALEPSMKPTCPQASHTQAEREHGLPASLRWRKTGLQILVSGYTRRLAQPG